MGKAAPLTDLGPTVRDLIARSGLKQVQLAARSGVPETTISALKNGRLKSQPDEVLVALAGALGVEVEVLRAADRRPRRAEGTLGLPEDMLRLAFHDVEFVPPQEQMAYWQEVVADVGSITRKYTERQRGLSRYPRQPK